MASAISPRNAVLQYTEVARATPAFAPRAQLRPRLRLTLTLPSARPRSMHDARNLTRNRIRNGRMRRNATTRRRRRHRRTLHTMVVVATHRG
jgi:hypothetical protein